MIQAQVKVEGLESFEGFVGRLRARLEDLQELMEEIARYGESSTVRRIKEGVPPPNAPLTRAWKKGNDTPLRDTGRLMASITHRAGRDFAAWGTNVPYARIQQLGGRVKPKKAKKLAIPAGWHTRRLMRRYGETPEKCLEGLRRAGWRIWFTDGAIMGQPPRKRGRAKPVVLFIRKKSVTIPARPFLKIDEQDKREILEIVREWIRGRR
ncbi:MAG: hypothetical protein DSZ24_03780 [Thermodesulfatator sp.]|nr:MAG: hypothetical protein DSZ24_03780 [Thermodesulfatator sp.]